MRGRPKKSPQQKALEGRGGPYAASVGVVVPMEPLEPPDTLEPAALAVWQRYAGELARWGRCSPVDQALLAGFCVCMARHEEAERLISAEGIVYKGATGLKKQHPAAAASVKYLTCARQIAEQFGFSPGARVRIGAEDNRPETDDLDSI